MKFRNAIVRKPAKNFVDGITSGTLGKPDTRLAIQQHTAYCQALETCGLTVTALDADERYPDSTFVEDAAVLTETFALITRPGASSRLGEIESIRPVLETRFDVVYGIEPPGTMDGGDICQAESHFWIGISERTNQDGGKQLAALLKRHGYTATLVDCREIPGLLHLKSGIAYLGENFMAMVAPLDAHPAFAGYAPIMAAPGEPYAANCVRVNDRVLVAAGFPVFQEKLERLGLQTLPVNVSEFQKMDGGLSCLSLRY